MALTPLSVRLGEMLIRTEPAEEMDEDFEGAGADVMMIGFSRFGQMVSQVLLSGGTDVTIIDHSADRVRAAERFGFRIYFGDGRRKEVLEAAGIRNAKIVAVCTNGATATDQIVVTAGVPFNVPGSTNILRVAPCDERLIYNTEPE